MRQWLVRAAAVVAIAAAFVSAPRTTRAQTTPVSALDKGIASPVDSMLQEALASKKAEHNARRADPNNVAAAPSASAAPASPMKFSDSLETPKPGILYPNSPGVHFTADISSAFPEGNIGYTKNSLPMGQDVALFIGPDKYTRLLVGYYTVQQYPVGFDNGLIPSYVQTTALPGGAALVGALGPRIPCATAAAGIPNIPPGICGTAPGTVNYNQANENIVQADATIDQKVMIAALSRLIWFGFGLPGLGSGGYLPVVITPNYVATKSFVGGHGDVYLAYNPNNGTYQAIHLRSSEQKGFLITIPFADSSKLFATYNIGPQWLVNTNGFNQGNSAQFIQYMDIRYFATKKDTIFFQPSRLPLYYPTDFYPEHEITYIYGFNHSFAKGLFMQGLITSGFPQNPQYGHSGRLGAIDATCVSFPSCLSLSTVNFQTNTAITYGSERATTFQLQFGVGTPSAIPL